MYVMISWADNSI